MASRPPIDPGRRAPCCASATAPIAYHRLDAAGAADLATLPYTVKVLLENALRHAGGDGPVSADDVRALASWDPSASGEVELPFMPGRVILQDFTGVPCVVDLAAMRDAVAEMGGDPSRINPLVPADLVIDHSVQVDQYGSEAAFLINVEREYERNGERYALLRWAQQAFDNFRSSRRGPASCTRSTWSSWPTWSARARRRRPAGRLPGHAGRHRLAHDHDQRPGRGGLGRGRHRGRGRTAGPAALPADADRGRLPAGRRDAGRLHRHRPGADRDRDAARARRGRQVRRVPRPGLSRLGLADRATISNMSPEFGATATSSPSTTRRCATCA